MAAFSVHEAISINLFFLKSLRFQILAANAALNADSSLTVKSEPQVNLLHVFNTQHLVAEAIGTEARLG